MGVFLTVNIFIMIYELEFKIDKLYAGAKFVYDQQQSNLIFYWLIRL